jgi:chemotaxis methyl-accepting protein methylase
VTNPPLEDPGFEELKQSLVRLTGWDLTRFKENYLRRRVGARLRAVGAASWQDYSAVLAADPGELVRLKDRLTVHVTEFLRDADVWAALSESVLPRLLEAAAARPVRELRIWSAGCSSGEEPYSLAMLALEGARRQAKGVRVRVMASDLDAGVLERARAGIYSAEALRLVPAALREEFFVPAPEGNCAVGAELRRSVAWRVLDLFSSPPPPHLDLLLCRNVMIYFSRDLQQRLLQAFHQALRPNGVFVTGKTETILGPVRDSYRCLSAPARIFERA